MSVKRRWFRFSLRTLFVLVAVCAAVMGWIVYQLSWISQRREFIAAEKRIHEGRGVLVTIAFTYPPLPPVRAPSLLWAFGADGFTHVSVLSDEIFGPGDEIDSKRLTESDLERVRRARRLFPEASVMACHEARVSAGQVQFVGSYPPD